MVLVSLCGDGVAGLFLGDATAAADAAQLRTAGITHIVRCGSRAFHSDADFAYHHLAVRDGEQDAEKFGVAALAAVQFISDSVAGGGTVLVHCKAGMCRSPTLAVLYLHAARGMPLDVADAHVRQRRPVIRPRASFVDAFLDAWLLTTQPT
jgi:predicted protein tyrosine phosphatase